MRAQTVSLEFMFFRKFVWFLGTLLSTVMLIGSAIAAEGDVDGGADHPVFPRFPGFYLDDFVTNDFNRHEFIVGTQAKTEENVIAAKEGKYLQNTYFLKEGARRPSVIEIIRNYENATRRAGGAMVWSNPTDGLATYKQKDSKGEHWMALEAASQGAWMRMTVVDVANMEQRVEISSGEMLDALNRDGFVALTGILFDSGKDTIKVDSEALLQEILQLLKDNPKLRLSIDGHTDNVGSASVNLPLSKRRAEAVRGWLISKGIASSRLTAQGFGDTKPVADNRSETGRAQNRRVELVKLN